eukprot:scaffold10828_cov143-Isochrysis_galbana.AAC.4
MHARGCDKHRGGATRKTHGQYLKRRDTCSAAATGIIVLLLHSTSNVALGVAAVGQAVACAGECVACCWIARA